MKTFDLATIKEAATFSNGKLIWNHEEIDLSDSLLASVVILGVYRQASADSAKGGYNAEFETKFLTRLRAGFLNDRAYQNSLKVVTETKTATGKKPAFGQFEIVSMARSLTTDDKTLKSLDTVAAYDDLKFSLLLTKVADNPESIISKAIAELARVQAERVEAARREAMADLIDI